MSVEPAVPRPLRWSEVPISFSQSGLEIPSKKASKSSIQSTDDVALKAIQLQEGDSSKTAIISVGLGDK
jgi:hypothetical protein